MEKYNARFELCGACAHARLNHDGEDCKLGCDCTGFVEGGFTPRTVQMEVTK